MHNFSNSTKEEIHTVLLTVSRAIWNREATNDRTNEGSTYDNIEVAAATVSDRCSFLLY